MELDLLNYINEETIVMIPALWILATIIKKIDRIPNEFVPLLLLVVSLVFTPLLLGSYNPQNIVQAVLAVGAEMIAYQVWSKTPEAFKKDTL